MKKELYLVSGVIAALMLVGAGCADQNLTPTNTTSGTPTTSDMQPVDSGITSTPGNPTSTPATNPNPGTNTTSSSDLQLQVQTLGNGKVQLNWTVPATVSTTDGFLAVRGKTENPENNGKNYWYKTTSRNHQFIWSNIATGTIHIRLCALSGKTCTLYSNDVIVDVK